MILDALFFFFFLSFVIAQVVIFSLWYCDEQMQMTQIFAGYIGASMYIFWVSGINVAPHSIQPWLDDGRRDSSARFYYLIFYFWGEGCDWCDFQRLKWMSVVVPLWFSSSWLRVVVVSFLYFYAPGAPVALPRRARFHRLQLFSLFSLLSVWISRSFLSLSCPVLSGYICPRRYVSYVHLTSILPVDGPIAL